MAQTVKASAYNAGDPGWIPGLGKTLEKEMAIQSSTLAWKIPWMEEPARLQSMGSQRVGHDWVTHFHFKGGFNITYCLSTMRETWVRSLGREDPLEKEMAIHSSTIAWKIPRTEELGRLQSMGSQRVGHDWVSNLLVKSISQLGDSTIANFNLGICRIT